jgi:hypothetical protein
MKMVQSSLSRTISGVLKVAYLVCRKAIEVAVSSSSDQIVLTATSGPVSTIPRAWVLTAASPIEMSNIRGAHSITRPIVASMVATIIDCPSIESGTS